MDRDRIEFQEEIFDAEPEKRQGGVREDRQEDDREFSRRSARRRRAREARNNRSSAQLGVVIVLAVFFIGGILAGVLGGKLLSFLRSRSEDYTEEAAVTPEEERLEGIKQYFSEGRGVLETLRKYYPDDLVLYDDPGYSFFAIDRSLKQNSFDSSKVRISTDGTWGYIDGDMEVIKGIDVSSHQGEIDWAAVAHTNVQFAMIRAMYRGYETGKIVEDRMFRTNLESAQACGIKTGVYIFTQAVSTKEVDEELSMLRGLLGAYDIDYPVVVDVEDVAGVSERMEKLGVDERTELVRYYCEQIKEAGYTPMIYYNISGALRLLDLSKLEEYDKWFAVYDSDFYFPYAYNMWQYKDTGKVAGISGTVDFDLYFPGL